MRIENIDDGAIRAAIGEGFGKVARDRLGPAIRDAAKSYCPVDTGALRDSITDTYDEETDTLYVSATGGDDGRVYAAYQRGTRPSRVAPVHRHRRTPARSPKSIFEACPIYGAGPIRVNLMLH
jgi:hypothetical protein